MSRCKIRESLQFYKIFVDIREHMAVLIEAITRVRWSILSEIRLVRLGHIRYIVSFFNTRVSGHNGMSTYPVMPHLSIPLCPLHIPLYPWCIPLYPMNILFCPISILFCPIISRIAPNTSRFAQMTIMFCLETIPLFTRKISKNLYPTLPAHHLTLQPLSA